MFRPSHALLIFVTALACTSGTATEDTPVPSTELADDPLLLVGDIEHLLDRAFAERDVGDRVAAGATVDQAYLYFRTGVRPRFAPADQEVLLAAEYHFGLLATAIRKRGGKPKRHLEAVRTALSLARERVGAPATP